MDVGWMRLLLRNMHEPITDCRDPNRRHSKGDERGTTDNSSPQFLENKTVASAMSNSTLLPGCRRTLEQVPQIGNEAKIYQMKLRAASGRAVSHFGVLAAVEIAVAL